MSKLLVSLLFALAIGATCASAGRKGDAEKAALALVADLNDPSKMNDFTPDQILDMLKRSYPAVRAGSPAEGVPELVEASSVQENRCSLRHQQWLIRETLKAKGTPLFVYLQDIRDRYRKLCSQNLKSRLLQTSLELDMQALGIVEKLTQYLSESGNRAVEISKFDDVKFESMVEAVRQYVEADARNSEELVPQGSSSILRAIAAKRQLFHTIQSLIEACSQINEKIYDFLWMFKVIGSTEQLGGEAEQILWSAKVCRSLRFEQFEKDIERRYKQVDVPHRVLLNKFTNLLHISDDIWFDQEYQLPENSTRPAVDMLINERDFLTQSTDKLSEDEEADKVMSDIAEACKSLEPRLRDFLWIINVELVTDVDSTLVAPLKQTRLCQLLPFVK